MHQGDSRLAWPTIAWLGLVVAAFVVLSLLVTAAGTARFAVSMGYDAAVGYAAGVIFDLAKGSLLIAVLAFWTRRALLFAPIFALIWVCLVTFSWLATHATVMTAISSIERMGTWKMEVRGNTKAELATIEQQRATLSRPTPPRPAQTVREALSAERVPGSVWQDSHECAKIQDSTYFAKACAQVVQLRRELAASEDYERLSGRAAEMRKALAEAPIVPTSDPLPDAFSATLGRVLPVSGKDGVALLLTAVVELMSAFGFAGLRLLANAKTMGTADADCPQAAGAQESSSATARSLPQQRQATLPKASLPVVLPGRGSLHVKVMREASSSLSKAQVTLPKPSLTPAAPGGGMVRADEAREISNPPPNVLPMKPRTPSRTLPEGAFLSSNTRPEGRFTAMESHVSAFLGERLQKIKGTSIAFRELRSAYEVWCAAQGCAPLSTPKLAAALKELGFDKWKSCGLIRYRGLQLAA